MMRISVVGMGYIGLPTAALFALAGHDVSGFDVSAEVRRNIASGACGVQEEPVRSVVADALQSGKLRVTEQLEPADAYVICVPTPTIDHKPDLAFVEDAASGVAEIAEPGSIIVLESTVPPGTTDRLIQSALRAAGKDPSRFHIAHCPERVIPGAIIRELRQNDRVIGGATPTTAALVAGLYASFCQGEIHCTTTLAAEFVKVIENTYRDVNIAFANELAILGEGLGVDVWEAIALANRHPRVNILLPGPGVGGHCIPVDPQFLSNVNPLVTELIQAARRINERMPYHVVQCIADTLGRPAKVTLLGAAYKADVDDARESPCEQIDALLRARGYQTAIYDPHVTRFSRPLASTLEEAITGSEALVLVTDHREFANLDPAFCGSFMLRRIVIDTRHFLETARWTESSFECRVLGIPWSRRRVEAVA